MEMFVDLARFKKHSNKGSSEIFSKLVPSLMKFPSFRGTKTCTDEKLSIFKCLCQLFIVRFIISLLNWSYIVADEVWQSQEVAHYVVFGKGYLCWEWVRRIRSFLYPLLLVIPYQLLKILRIDTALSVRLVNHSFGALIGAMVDLCAWYIGSKIYNGEIANMYLFLSIFNAFNYTHQTRTLINILEGLLCQLFWICYCVNSAWNQFVLPVVTVGCILRPTFAINCLIPVVMIFFNGLARSPIRTVKNFFLMGISFLTLSTIIDYMFYQTLVPSWWNFLRFNILENLSTFYGVQDRLWYLWNGLPALSNIALAPFLYSILMSWRGDWFLSRILLGFIIPNILFYSILQHKEVRFLFQLQPFILLFAAKTICNSYWKRHFLFAYLLLNIPLALHFSMVHEVGSLQMLDYVNNIIKHKENPFVLFLSSCHVSHYHCYLHHNSVRLEMVSCDPPTCPKENVPTFQNDMIKLILNPGIFTIDLFQKFNRVYPNVIISQRGILNRNERQLWNILDAFNYKERAMFPTSRWSIEDNSKEDMFVFTRE